MKKIGNYELAEDQFNGKEKISGYLYLRSLTSIPEGFNPTVGVSLDLSSLTSIPEGFNPTVGGSLYLRSGLKANYTNLPDNHIFEWQNGKYIKCDGIFNEVVKRKGNVMHVKYIGKEGISYIVTDGNGKYSHGSTLKEAKEDLIFKISDRNKEDYRGLKLNDVLPFDKAIECYRVITGACSEGTKNFIKSKGIKKMKFSIQDIIDVTKGQYGNNEFKNFFS